MDCIHVALFRPVATNSSLQVLPHIQTFMCVSDMQSNCQLMRCTSTLTEEEPGYWTSNSLYFYSTSLPLLLMFCVRKYIHGPLFSAPNLMSCTHSFKVIAVRIPSCTTSYVIKGYQGALSVRQWGYMKSIATLPHFSMDFLLFLHNDFMCGDYFPSWLPSRVGEQ